MRRARVHMKYRSTVLYVMEELYNKNGFKGVQERIDAVVEIEDTILLKASYAPFLYVGRTTFNDMVMRFNIVSDKLPYTSTLIDYAKN